MTLLPDFRSIASRRGFLAAAAAFAGGAVGWRRRSLAAGDLPQGAKPRPASPSSWEKLGVVLPDDGGAAINFTSPAEPLGDGRWRLWYTAGRGGETRNVGFAEGTPGGTMTRRPAVLSGGEPADAPLAIGNLPQGWRPVQPVHLMLADGRHRIYFWAHGPKIVRYLAADSEDGRRYRVLDPLRPCLYHPADRAVDGRTAAEAGLTRWGSKAASRADGEPPATADLVSNDATNVYRVDDGSFEMYSVALVEVARDDPRYIAHDNAAGWVRVIDRYESDDGLHWTGRRRVLVPDADDPTDMQFYYLAVTHTPRGRVGMLGHYRVEAQTMDLEWCFSSDGVTWQRPARGPWIARGKPGDPDSYGIYAPHSLVFDEGRWHLFYSAVNSAHNDKHSYGPPRRVVMHAVCDRIWQ